MSISKEQYLKALDIVEQYHLELKVRTIQVEKQSSKYKDMSYIKQGDYVECVNNCIQSQNNLTIGKTYEVLNCSLHNNNIVIYIRTDKNIIRPYRVNKRFFKLLR